MYRRIAKLAYRGYQELIGLRLRQQIQVNTIYLGSDYGGWTICPDDIGPESIVYSFGVGDDISFDLALIAQFDLNIYAFDPTPRSINWIRGQQLPANFNFTDIGLADYDGQAAFSPPDNPLHVSYTLLERPQFPGQLINAPVQRLDSIAAKFGHTHIDILKMDIEGAEYGVISDLKKSAIGINQLLVEFHHRFDSVSYKDTKNASSILKDLGFRIFSVSASGLEVSFIRI